MNDSETTTRKLTSQQRKHSVSEKTRSENPCPNSPHQYCPVLMSRPIKNLGRKYAQEHLFKVEQKQHHEIVISDEVVRNSKLYRVLRQKIQIREALFVKQSKQLKEAKQKLASEIAQINHKNHNSKLNLWQLKNQILELKAMLIDQEQEAKRLEFEMHNPQQPLYAQQDEEAEQEMPNQQSRESEPLSSEDFQQNNKQEWLELDSNELKQEQKDIKVLMSHLHKKIGLNPENQKQASISKAELKEEQIV